MVLTTMPIVLHAKNVLIRSRRVVAQVGVSMIVPAIEELRASIIGEAVNKVAVAVETDSSTAVETTRVQGRVQGTEATAGMGVIEVENTPDEGEDVSYHEVALSNILEQ